MAFNIGDKVGDYQIAGILGAGGMGTVYKVRNVVSDRIEAMKVLPPDPANESELAGRFIREIKLLASLNHPNIAALHTAMRLDDRLVVTMEFVEGKTLEARMREGRLPAIEGVNCMIGVLSALAYAHERGAIHGDIKPGNMMLTPAGEVKLMDFGIAKAAAGSRPTAAGTTPGSLYYMSPEQVKGSAGLDGRSDLYSVGVSLYEVTTGVRPFRGDSDYSIMVAHLEQDRTPPIELDPKIPAALNETIMTAIAKDAGDRFQTADAFRKALEAVRQSLSAPAPAALPAQQQQPQAQSKPQPAAPAAQDAPLPFAALPQNSGHRGVWMALGALIVLAALAGTAIQAPWWRASGAAQTEAAGQRSAPPAAAPGRPSPEPAGGPAPQAEATPAAIAPAAAAAAPFAPSSSSFLSRAAQPQAGPDPEGARQLRERMINLGSRAKAARASLQKLEQAQSAQGLPPSAEITATRLRLEALLNEAESNLKAGNITEARRKTDQAETALKKIEEFLGR